MRTVQQQSATINKKKFNDILDMVVAFNKQKDYWLLELQKQENFLFINQFRVFRNLKARSGYKSKYTTQAKLWKLALDEACKMMHLYWTGLLEKVKSSCYKHPSFNDKHKHYVNYILKDNSMLYTHLTSVLQKQIVPFDKNDLTVAEKQSVINYLLRKIKQYRGKYPRVKLFRSVAFDSDMYDILTTKDGQYISIMCLTPRKRITIPLMGCKLLNKGNTTCGSIKLILDKPERKIFVHSSHTIDEKAIEKEIQSLGLDTGYTEVFADSEGAFYGEDFGKLTTKEADNRRKKGRARNKLRALAKKYLKRGNINKAQNIQKFNLGSIKNNKQIRCTKITIERMVNESINAMIKKGYNRLVTEDLSHTFGNSNKGRATNNRLSGWRRGVISERLEFKALVHGIEHKEINAAYTSQICPVCSYVDSKNRKDDSFECLHCGHKGHSDTIAAINILERSKDKEIKLGMKKETVKAILMKRFNKLNNK